MVHPYLGRTCVCVTHRREAEDDALSNTHVSFQYICLFPIHIYVPLNAYVYFFKSICMSLSIYTRLFLHPSVRLSLYTYIYVPFHTYISFSICISLCKSIPRPHVYVCDTYTTGRGGGLGSRPIFKKFHETYAPS